MLFLTYVFKLTNSINNNRGRPLIYKFHFYLKNDKDFLCHAAHVLMPLVPFIISL